METIIINADDLTLTKTIFAKSEEKKYGGSSISLLYSIIQDDLKSFKSAPNGMKWTADEKAKFEKLSHVEKKKYLINKMGFKGGVLFPHLNVENLYKYPAIKDDISKDQYARAQNMLSSSNRSFATMDRKTQDEVLNYLREASFRNNLIASKDLADLLLARIDSVEETQGIKDIKESLNLYNKLIKAGSPDGYYGYYAIYRFTMDTNKLLYSSITPQSLGLNETVATKYLDEALMKGQKNALLDLAFYLEGTILAVDLFMTAGYLYQDRNAFELAMRSANYDLNSNNYEIFYIACMRMAIMLGGNLDELIACYANNVFIHKNPMREDALRQYSRNRKLIDGLDPYFDETFPPDLVLDFGTQFFNSMYGGTSDYPGVFRWIEIGKMKDPRDKDSTKKSVQDFYNKLWQIIIHRANYYIEFQSETSTNYYSLYDYVSHILYNKYSSGFTSARPYIFPQDVLSTKIDYNKIPPRDLK